MNAPTIRIARAVDAEVCAAIKNAWIDAAPWMPRVHPAEHVERYCREVVLQNQLVLVAGAPDGQGHPALAGAEVTSLFVAGAPRGLGIGAALMNRAKVTRDEPELWTFQVNEGARRFYARHGFVEVARTDGENEEGLPDVQMRWPGGSA